MDTAGIGVFYLIRHSTNYLWHRRIMPLATEWTVAVGGVYLSLTCNMIRLYLHLPADVLTSYFRAA